MRGAGTISLEQLIALNDEIAALVRAGVPLAQGLASIGGDLPGRTGKLATALSERLGRGETLSAALAAEGAAVPPAYTAVVEAGLRSGRLAAALEAVAASARRLFELRRTVALAFAYPLLVLFTAGLAFMFYAILIAPRFAAAFRSFRLPQPVFLTWLATRGDEVAVWTAVLLFLILVAAAVSWRLSGRAATGLRAVSGRLLNALPWTGATLRWSRAAVFSEIAALLVEQQVPLHEALPLAADSTGDPALERHVRQLAAALQRGQPATGADQSTRLLPPLLVWLLTTGQRQGALAAPLRQAAESYRRRALYQAESARVALPLVLTMLIGGTATLAYALAVFLPWAALLRGLVHDAI